MQWTWFETLHVLDIRRTTTVQEDGASLESHYYLNGFQDYIFSAHAHIHTQQPKLYRCHAYDSYQMFWHYQWTTKRKDNLSTCIVCLKLIIFVCNNQEPLKSTKYAIGDRPLTGENIGIFFLQRRFKVTCRTVILKIHLYGNNCSNRKLVILISLDNPIKRPV